MSNLKLVHGVKLSGQSEADAELHLDERVLRSEATALSALIGQNPYSNFVLKFGRRPDRSTAATIGCLMGTQVKAADGSMQPPRTAAERAAVKEARRLRRISRKKNEQVMRLRSVLEDLSATDDDPSVVAHAILGIDESEITKKLNKSIEWLQRFAEEWQSRGKQQEIGGGS
jgi:hypothetical protein